MSNDRKSVSQTLRANYCPKQRRVGIAICEQTSMTTLLLACEPMRAVNRFFQSPVYDLIFVGASRVPVRGDSGTVIKIDTTYDNADDRFDVVIVASLHENEAETDGPLRGWLQRHAGRGIEVCGLEHGVVCLAQAGLLDGHRAALHWRHRPDLAGKFNRVWLTDTLFAIDRGRLTCGGGMAANDLFLKVVEQHHGKEMARFVEADIISMPARAPDARQHVPEQSRSAAEHVYLRRTIALMEANIRRPLSIPEIADRLGVSVRQLQLLSRRHFDETLSNRYLDIRLKAARQMLMYSDRSIVEIVAETGFSSASSFARAFKRRFQTNAGGYRSTFGRAGSQPLVEWRA